MKWMSGILFLTALLCLAGCSTTKEDKKAGDWILYFSPNSGTNDVYYSTDRISTDFSVLSALSAELDSLEKEWAVLKRELLFKERGYESDLENKKVELMLFRFTNALDSLWDMVAFYRSASAPDKHVQTKGGILGMRAELEYSYHSSRFSALFHDQKKLIPLLNTAHPSFGISEGTYDHITYNVTSIDYLERLDLVWYLFCKELSNPDSELSKVRNAQPEYAELISEMDGLHAGAHLQTEYILYARWSHFPELKNRLAHGTTAKIGDEMAGGWNKSITETRGFVFKNVARMKSPTSHVLVFSDTQTEQIKSLLQPGDILLTYTAGYMSDVFLPGNFKHGITYIGTVEQRRKAGLTNSLLNERAVSEEQGSRLIKEVETSTTPDGYPVNIIEAVAEGVVMHSLDKLLKTHINRLVVIRPQFTEQERLNQLVLLFQYVGAPYDFKFDFEDDGFQCCTEVVYRTTDGKGSIDFSLEEMKGRWILSADDILHYHLADNPKAFEFILLVDQSPDKDNYNAEVHTGEAGLATLYELMEIRQP